MKNLEQQRCPKDDTLGLLQKVSIDRFPLFNNPRGVRFRWICQKCHDVFETSIPYLEIQDLGEQDETRRD